MHAVVAAMLAACLPAAGMAAALAPLEETGWLSEPVTVNAGGVEAFNPGIAVGGNSVYAVWESARGIMLARSPDWGETFSDPVLVAGRNPDSSVGADPAVAAVNDSVFVLYSSGKDIFLVRSRDGGESFSAGVNVSRTAIDSPAVVVTDHVMSVWGDRVYVAWTVSNFNWSEIYFAQSPDGGRTFGEPKNVSQSPDQPSQLPRMASSGSQVYLAWYDIDGYYALNHVSFAASRDGGDTFGRIANLSGNERPYGAFEHGVAVGSDGVYVVWREEREGPPAIVVAKSTDSGRTFGPAREVAHGGWPAMAVEGDNVYLAFGVQENGTDNVGFVGSLDGGRTFSQPVMLSSHTWGLSPYDDRPFPRISADGSSVFVSWRYTANGTSSHETYLAASYDAGGHFTPPLEAGPGPGDARSQPLLLAAPVDTVFVMWPEQRGDVVLVRGEVPAEYAAPFREVSQMTPAGPAGYAYYAALAALAAAGVLYYAMKRRFLPRTG